MDLSVNVDIFPTFTASSFWSFLFKTLHTKPSPILLHGGRLIFLSGEWRQISNASKVIENQRKSLIISNGWRYRSNSHCHVSKHGMTSELMAETDLTNNWILSLFLLVKAVMILFVFLMYILFFLMNEWWEIYCKYLNVCRLFILFFLPVQLWFVCLYTIVLSVRLFFFSISFIACLRSEMLLYFHFRFHRLLFWILWIFIVIFFHRFIVSVNFLSRFVVFLFLDLFFCFLKVYFIFLSFSLPYLFLILF